MSDIPPRKRSPSPESTSSEASLGNNDRVDASMKVETRNVDEKTKADVLDGPIPEQVDQVDVIHEDLKDFVYPMNRLKNSYCGLFVIFNHKKFARLDERLGTEKDCKALEKLWSDLGFDVRVHNDLTLDEIMSKIRGYAECTDYSNYSCFACAVLSHGKENGVAYAKDKKYNLEKEIVEPFRDCQTLVGKPKLFFIQACRGRKVDDGKKKKNDVPDADPDKVETLKIPSEADFLIAYSTVEGYYSWRDETSGSWFIQTLVECIRNHHSRLDLLQLLTLVNKKVGKRESNTEIIEYMGKKQSPSIVCRLTRLLYLGCNEDGEREFQVYKKDFGCTDQVHNQHVPDCKNMETNQNKRDYYKMKLETCLKKKELAELEEKMYRMRLQCQFY